MTSVFTFASAWALSAQGREDLLRVFRASKGGPEAEIYPETSGAESISMRCTEQCSISFVEAASKFYFKELAQERNTFEEPRLTRISGTSACGGSLVPERAPGPQYQIPFVIRENQLVEHENYTWQWSPTHQDERGNTSFRLLPIIVRKIETITPVRIKQSLNKYNLTVAGDAEALVSKAVQKLNVLEETLARRPFIHNHLVLEGELCIQLQMLPLKEIPDSRLKTTLLSHKSSQYRCLLKSHVLVLVRDGEVLTVKPNVQDDEDDDDDYSTHLWQGHELSIYSPKGLDHHPIKANSISTWVDESNAAPNVDPFSPIAINDVSPEHVILSSAAKPSSEKVSTKRVRKVKGAVDVLQRSDSHDQMLSVDTGLVELQLGASNLGSSEPARQASAYNNVFNEASMDALSPSKSEFRQSWAILQTAGWPANKAPNIRPPYMPLPATGVTRAYEPSRHKWEDHVVVPVGQSVDVLIDLDPAPASTQQTKAVYDKTHRTMDHKKSHIIPKSDKLFKAFTTDVLEMLCSVVARPHVQICTAIGRILIDRHTIPAEVRKKPFDVKDWPYAVNHLRTEFTGRLTTKSSDMLTILNIKAKHGRMLFAETPTQCKIMYIMECFTRNNEQIMIEVSEDGSFMIRGDTILNGTLNWHFGKRAWDARFLLTSGDFIGGDYQQEIRSLVDSIKRSRSPSGLGISISFHNEAPKFQVQSMCLLREVVYIPTTYPDLRLHLTEVQDLKVSQSADDTNHYNGTIEPQDQMVANHRLWWEVSISSQHATNILKETENLELGEMAQWMPEQITERGMVEDMYTLAQEIVTRIDHVGVKNKGPAVSGSNGMTRPSARSYELPTGIPGFW